MQRLSFYRVIHKAIRAMLLDLVVRAGRVDWTDATDVAAFRKQMQNAFALLAAHAEHEERVVAPMLDLAAISTARVIGSAHRDQETDLQNLMLMLDAVDPAAEDAASAGHVLVVALSRFAGESLAHMADEEELAMPALWRAYDDAQIEDAYKRILAGVTPDQMGSMLPWIAPSINRAERMEFVGATAAIAANQ